MISNPREAAVTALYKTERCGAYSNRAVAEAISGLEPRDRALANEIIMGVLKNKTRIDYIIQAFSKMKLKKVNPWVLQILRAGVYQMTMMDKIPPSAACNEGVKLASKYAHAAKGFVNGVLRSVSRNLDALPCPSRGDAEEYLSCMYSCPKWLTKKLISQFGEEKCEEILSDSLLPHPVMLRVNTTKATPEEVIALLQNEGVTAKQSEELSQCLIVDGAIDVASSSAFKDGYYTPQNINSMRAALALTPKAGELVIDVCAAPGGKTTHIAELMENRGEIIAFDVHPHKIRLIENAAKRLGITCIGAAVNNSENVVGQYVGRADRVLADVPCSGIGVIHKKPDIKWNRSSADTEALTKIQTKIINAAAQYVKPGGVLVYSTCTILKEENSDITDEFIREHTDFEKEHERLYLADETGGSGFYICRLKKRIDG